MANEYISLRNNDLKKGNYAISTSVFESIALIVANEFDNVELSEKSGLKNPINCRIEDNNLILTISLKIKYGSNLNDTCLHVQNKINEAIIQMTSVKCLEIDIKIIGFII